MEWEKHLGSLGGQSALVALTIVLLVVVRRNSRPRALRVERLWIRPVIFALLIGTSLASAPPAPTPANLALLAVAAVVGGALGWQRGRLMHITVNPETHDLTSKASPIGMIVILGLVVLRLGLRGAISNLKGAPMISAIAAADSLIVLAGAMMMVQNLEMWLRAQRLLTQARAAKIAG